MSTTPTTVSKPGYRAGRWKVDPERSEIDFSVRFLTVGMTRGRFTDFDATLAAAENPIYSQVTASIRTASVDTANAKRDTHLRSDQYLEVEKYPAMSYRSTGFRHTDTGWIIDGELTAHGTTRPVPLKVVIKGFGPSHDGRRRAEFSATAVIDRRDFGIHVPLDGRGSVVGRKVTIGLHIEAVLED
ncbi:YceI family protein [Nocardia speluncae]|uniref:YceI family protein n=1 Tax=Nocardia speluncae TaxID=419477 RepID=A0A846XE15_9NOCA|nr:YceI family protein [Nocardia speluncae]NKY33419.1 YceI family protein [Nocardia speluncae]